MLGQHGIGTEHAGLIEGAFRHDALPFAEQVRQQALIGDRHSVVAVGHLKLHLHVIGALQTARRDKPAKPDARAGGDLFLRHVGRRIEEDNGFTQRAQHQADGERKHAEADSNQGEAALAARHQLSSPRPLTSSSSRRSFSLSSPMARRASAAAERALSRSPSTL